MSWTTPVFAANLIHVKSFVRALFSNDIRSLFATNKVLIEDRIHYVCKGLSIDKDQASFISHVQSPGPAFNE